MTLLFVILIILACVVLGVIVLIQNPKGGGLAGNIAGFSTQFMGVKQTTDVLEKGTWLFSAIVGLLALFSTLLISSDAGSTNGRSQEISAPPPSGTNSPNTTSPFQTAPGTTTSPDTTK